MDDGPNDIFAELLELTAQAMRPADPRPIEDWAGEHLDVGGWSPWEGKFSAIRTPWIIEPLAAFQRPTSECWRITIMAAAAGGKSTVAELCLLWLIANAPGFSAWFAHHDAAAKEFALTRIQRLLSACAPVRAYFEAMSRHARSTQAVHFPHMDFLILPANEGAAQSKHLRYLFLDETWQYEPGMLGQLHKRTTRFSHNRKILELSTGSQADDETAQAFAMGSRREWQFLCPYCGEHDAPKWSFDRKGESPGGVKWSPKAKRDDGTWDYKAVRASTAYECRKCRTRHDPTQSAGYLLNKHGIYTPAAPDAANGHESFRWNAITSSYELLPEMVVEFLEARAALRRGTTELLQEFVQKRLAEAWAPPPPEESSARIQSDYTLESEWTEHPNARPIMTVDVQISHFWIVIRSWDRGPVSRLRFAGRADDWATVREIQINHGVQSGDVLCDSSHFSDKVYRECCRWGWHAIKGDKAPGGYKRLRKDGRTVREMSRPAEGNATPSSLAPGSALRSCKLFFVSEELTSQALAHYRSGSDAQGWSIAADTPVEYLQQLAARQRFQRPNQRTGQPVWEWRTIGKCGEHLWDCERYQLAAAQLAGLLAPVVIASTPTKPKPTDSPDHESTS